MKLNERGVSLVEIIAAMAIIGIIAIVFANATSLMFKNETYAKALQHNTQVGQTIMEQLTKEKSLPSSSTYAGITNLAGSFPQYNGNVQNTPVVLEFTKIQSLDEQPHVVITQNGDVITVRSTTSAFGTESRICTKTPLEISYNSATSNLQICGFSPKLGNYSGKLVLEFIGTGPLAITSDSPIQLIVPSGVIVQKNEAVEVVTQSDDVQIGTLYEVSVSVEPNTPAQFVTTNQFIFR